MKITTEQAVRALQARRTSQTAALIASDLGAPSRAVATALRPAVADGRVTQRWVKGEGAALYRFVRVSPEMPDNSITRLAREAGGVRTAYGWEMTHPEMLAFVRSLLRRADDLR